MGQRGLGLRPGVIPTVSLWSAFFVSILRVAARQVDLALSFVLVVCGVRLLRRFMPWFVVLNPALLLSFGFLYRICPYFCLVWSF